MKRHPLNVPVILMLLAFLLPLMGGCATDKQVISQAASVHTGLQPAVITDPQLAAYIQTVGDRVIDAAKVLDAQGFGPESHRSESSAWMFSQGMQFHLVASDTLNAFTTGGEHMYVYSKLFEQCRDEDELAAVVAHEFAHVYCRHVQKGMNRQYAMLGGAAVAGAAGYAVGGKDNRSENALAFAGAAAAAGQFIGMGYTRGDERQADQLGFQFYAHAGWDPAQFPGFFRTLIAEGYDKTPEYASDHPTLASRVEAAKQWAAELPPAAVQWRKPDTASPQQFAALKQRVQQITRSMPNDKTLSQARMLLAAFPSCVTPVDQPGQKQARASLQQYLRSLSGQNK